MGQYGCVAGEGPCGMCTQGQFWPESRGDCGCLRKEVVGRPGAAVLWGRGSFTDHVGASKTSQSSSLGSGVGASPGSTLLQQPREGQSLVHATLSCPWSQLGRRMVMLSLARASYLGRSFTKASPNPG